MAQGSELCLGELTSLTHYTGDDSICSIVGVTGVGAADTVADTTTTCAVTNTSWRLVVSQMSILFFLKKKNPYFVIISSLSC